MNKLVDLLDLFRRKVLRQHQWRVTMNKLVDLLDFLRRKVLRQHQWRVMEPGSKRAKRVRVDCLPVEQFNYQRQVAAARLQSMTEAS